MRHPSRMEVGHPLPGVAEIKLMEMDHDKVAKNYSRYAGEFRKISGVR